MKKITWFGVFTILLTSCSAKKKIQEQIVTGNYDRAISMIIQKLKKKRNTKKGDVYVMLLEEAYAKAQQRDLQEIERLKKDTHADKWHRIYELYNRLMERQERIQPLLPLKIISENRQARFEFKDYTSQLLQARDQMIANDYDKALKLMQTGKTEDYRQAYDILENIDRIYPDYRDVKKLMDQAKRYGTTYVGVVLENQTQKIIPSRLEETLLDFSSLNANNFWTYYEPVKGKVSDYDYLVKLIYTDIYTSPEKEQEKIYQREREVKVGWDYVRDQNGNIVKDSLGNAIKQDVYQMVRATVHQYRQFKEARIVARVEIFDPATGQKLHSEPLQSHFVFENIYLNVQGDKRALDDELNQFINNVKKPFPTDEEMILDAGEDLKRKFEAYLSRLEFK